MEQIKTPNLNAYGRRGWCLEYVDNANGTPYALPPRLPSARAAFEAERNAGRIRTSDLPMGVWVVVFFDLTKGQYKDLDHIALARRNFDETVTIYDSEVAGKARPAYNSIKELEAWFGNHGAKYVGWSPQVSGTVLAKEVPSKKGGKAKGTATVIVDALNVRNSPSTNSPIAAVYKKNDRFNYDSWSIENGFVWLSYISFSGVRRYVAEGPADNNKNNVYVRGGVSK